MNNKEKFIRKHPIPKILRLLSPSYSYCGICGLPWNHCEGKTVWFSFGTTKKGTFATCTYCWGQSSLAEVKIAHIDTYRKQEMGSEGPMEVSLSYMLRCVEIEYIKTH